jgi:LEA14-like dessication related protein
MMKRKIACVCVAFAALSLFTCGSMPGIISEPVLSLDSVSLAGISFEGVNLIARLNIKNGNPIAIPFPEIDWAFFVSDELFINGIIKNDKKLAANKTTSVEIPVTVFYEGLYSTLTNVFDADEAPYRIETGARFAIPLLGDKRFSSEFSGIIPMLKMPGLSFGGVRFTSLNLSKVEFVLMWAVENKNVFPISLEKLSYDFSVNNSSWAKGQAPSKLSLPARKTTQIPVTVSVNSLSVIKDIVAMASSGKSAAFRCGGEAALRPAFEGLGALSLPFNYAGTTNFGK